MRENGELKLHDFHAERIDFSLWISVEQIPTVRSCFSVQSVLPRVSFHKETLSPSDLPVDFSETASAFC